MTNILSEKWKVIAGLPLVEAAKSPGSNFEDWVKPIKEKYPDLQLRTVGQHGWTSVGADSKGPTLTPHNDGPHYTEVSSDKYSRTKLIGVFNHNDNSGKLFIPLK